MIWALGRTWELSPQSQDPTPWSDDLVYFGLIFLDPFSAGLCSFFLLSVFLAVILI